MYMKGISVFGSSHTSIKGKFCGEKYGLQLIFYSRIFFPSTLETLTLSYAVPFLSEDKGFSVKGKILLSQCLQTGMSQEIDKRVYIDTPQVMMGLCPKKSSLG